ncbi:prepilin-type N-terminal cleavage/methylation domain-containing protein [Candidatus Saccharibacteria bacterium]|nr:prepilin-type N-terminal cleavage/methylation domain-containing protein [Candidatus Saccharibacteria bacterium]
MTHFTPAHAASRAGFTIVELLIVIVVIGILGAIVLNTFASARERGYESAIQSDVRNAAQKIKAFHAENGYYPNTASELAGLKLSFTKDAYDGTVNGMIYCTITGGANERFSIGGWSKAGKRGHYYSSASGLKQTTSWTNTNASLCPLLNVDATAPGYINHWGLLGGNNWQSWTN